MISVPVLRSGGCRTSLNFSLMVSRSFACSGFRTISIRLLMIASREYRQAQPIPHQQRGLPFPHSSDPSREYISLWLELHHCLRGLDTPSPIAPHEPPNTHIPLGFHALLYLMLP